MPVIEDSLDEATPEAKEVLEGHAAHTKADKRPGLPGTMPRRINVTMMGAGSFFTTYFFSQDAGKTVHIFLSHLFNAPNPNP